MNAYVSATSWMTLLVGLPAPCPDFVSTSINRGFVCLGLRPTMYCRVAMYLREWRGTTRSSWSPVSRSTAGYWTPLPSGTQMLWSGEYLARQRRGAHRSHMSTRVEDNVRASHYKLPAQQLRITAVYIPSLTPYQEKNDPHHLGTQSPSTLVRWQFNEGSFLFPLVKAQQIIYALC